MRYSWIAVCLAHLAATGCGDDSPTIDCDKVTEILYTSRGSAPPCNPGIELRINIDGLIGLTVYELENTQGIEHCLDAEEQVSAPASGQTRTMMSTICSEFNREHCPERVQRCVGAQEDFQFFDGEQQLARTNNLACTHDMMEDSKLVVSALEDEF